jgi:Concanavalin A-like lectin/glucanases superfamily
MARQFDGWTMAAGAALGAGMSATNRCTIAMWAYIDNFDNPNGQVLFETGAQYDLLGTHGFALYANENETVVTLATFGSDGTYAYARFDWPPNSVWFHWAIVIDRSQIPPIALGPVYVNAVPQTLALDLGSDSANFPNENFYVFARNLSVGFTSGNLFDLAVWGTVLNADEVLSLSNKSCRPDQVQPGSLIGYWPMEGFVSPEPAAGGTTIDMSLTGGPTQVSNPAPFAIKVN